VLLTALTGVAYPLVMTGLARVLFPAEAAGSLVVRDGRPAGSSLIGQPFDDPRCFWGRPSATGPLPFGEARVNVLAVSLALDAGPAE
jgi:K+-transporting ATPase ATPase C chain